MTTKIVDIADEIYREIGEPDNTSISSIAYWLRANIGELNLLLNKNYSIDPNTLEISSVLEDFGVKEKAILKTIYIINYYEKLFRNALGAASVDSVVSVTDDGSTVVKINKNEVAKNYAQLRKQVTEELDILVKNYNLNESKPIQVVGDDIIGADFRNHDLNTYIRS